MKKKCLYTYGGAILGVFFLLAGLALAQMIRGGSLWGQQGLASEVTPAGGGSVEKKTEPAEPLPPIVIVSETLESRSAYDY